VRSTGAAGRSFGEVSGVARRARGRSAGGAPRGRACGHAGDQLVSDAHQREAEQVLPAVAAVLISGAPDEVLGVFSASGLEWVRSSAQP